VALGSRFLLTMTTPFLGNRTLTPVGRDLPWTVVTRYPRTTSPFFIGESGLAFFTEATTKSPTRP